MNSVGMLTHGVRGMDCVVAGRFDSKGLRSKMRISAEPRQGWVIS